MAQKIKIQDGVIVYSTNDPAVTDINFGVEGQMNVTKEVNVGDDPLANGSISTPDGSGVDLIINTNTDGVTNGNIRLEPVPGGNIILNNVSWPDGTVEPDAGMFTGASSLNNLQFYSFILPGLAPTDTMSRTDLNNLYPNAVVGQYALGPNVMYVFIGAGNWRRVDAPPVTDTPPPPTNLVTFTYLVTSGSMSYYSVYQADYGALPVGDVFNQNSGFVPFNTTFPSSTEVFFNPETVQTVIGTVNLNTPLACELVLDGTLNPSSKFFVGYWTQAFGPPFDPNVDHGGPLTSQWYSDGFYQDYGGSGNFSPFGLYDILGLVYSSSQLHCYLNGVYQGSLNLSNTGGNFMCGTANGV